MLLVEGKAQTKPTEKELFMPSYVSYEGTLFPAKEHVVLPHLTGTEKEVYDGPDRAAEFELAQAHGTGEDGKPLQVTFGQNFRSNPDFINFVRQQGFTNIDEYLKFIGYDAAKSKEVFDKKAADINKYQPQKRNPEKLIMGGGIDTSGKGGDLIGGFGSERERPAKELER
jgi:hypothetical protein